MGFFSSSPPPGASASTAGKEKDLLLDLDPYSQHKINFASSPSGMSKEGQPETMSFPQAIAHRGFRAKFPENTMSSFMGAIDVGAHALETDLHLTRDNVVVLSHDATLLRCFGVDKRIIECDYSYIETLRTLKSSSEKMPTLKALLQYLRDPTLEHVWLLLDIKLDNDPEDVMRFTADVLREVGGGGSETWGGRVLLGIWALKYVPLCEKHMPGFPITHIGGSISYARQFLKLPSISFNLHHAVLSSRTGSKFIDDARKAGRNVYAWTVNDNGAMRWSICSRIEGVCVDDPLEFFRVCREYTPEWDNRPYWGWTKGVQLRILRCMVWVFSFFFRWKYAGPRSVERKLVEERLHLLDKALPEAVTPAVTVKESSL